MKTEGNPAPFTPASGGAGNTPRPQHSLAITLAIACGAMICGGLIYLLCRPVLPLFPRWVELTDGEGLIPAIRAVTVPLSAGLPPFFVYSTPQGLWAFSYALIITALWSPPGPNRGERRLWLASVPLVPLGFEALQHAGIIPGASSFGDLILSFAGIITGVLWGWIRRN